MATFWQHLFEKNHKNNKILKKSTNEGTQNNEKQYSLKSRKTRRWTYSRFRPCCYNHRVITKIRYFRDIVIGFCNKIATNLFVIMRDNAEICMFHSIW